MLLGTLLVAACGGGTDDTGAPSPLATAPAISFPDPPVAPDGPNEAATARFEEIIEIIPTGSSGAQGLDAFVDAGDARHAWLLADLLRFAPDRAAVEAYLGGFEALTGVDLSDEPDVSRTPWNVATNPPDRLGHAGSARLPAPER